MQGLYVQLNRGVHMLLIYIYIYLDIKCNGMQGISAQ